MNRAELISDVCLSTGATRKQADRVLVAVLDSIMGAVAEGDKVTLVGFGSFEGRKREAYVARNPKTSEEIPVPAKRLPCFNPGKEFRHRTFSLLE